MLALTKRPLNILQISKVDIGGGAEKVASNLFEGYCKRGHDSWLAVGSRRGSGPGVIEISTRPGLWSSFCRKFGKRLQPFEGRVPGIWRAAPFCESPRREIQNWLGIEDFNFPASRGIVKQLPVRPDIIHCHNLHDSYFDLRELPSLSREAPTILTLHDAWLMSGHCAHSLDCERWKTGCGDCPDLTIYPAIQRDATAYNWRRKRNIFARSRFYVSTPSEWLMRKVMQSILASAVVEARVIRNGVDTSVFRPRNQQTARGLLGISPNCRVLLFAANKIRRNAWKDYDTMRKAVTLVAENSRGKQIIFVALGEQAPVEHIGHAELRFDPYQSDPERVAAYYQAADIYLHATRADTFPNTVLEALACGTPVVATAVGGIPEQVKGLAMERHRCATRDLNRYGPDEATGTLVPAGDASAMADCIQTLLDDELLRRQLSSNAAHDAQDRFDLRRQIDNFLNWYHEILNLKLS